MQRDNMKLHAILSKFHIEHAQNRATVQHIQSKQDITTICPKQQLRILQASKRHATAPQHENKRDGRDVQVRHEKARRGYSWQEMMQTRTTHQSKFK